MSYSSEFYFDDDKKIVLPFDFFNCFPTTNSDEINILIQEQQDLSILQEDVMTVKQLRRLEELEKLLYGKNINAKQFCTEPYKNKYGFNCIETNSYVIASIFLRENREYNFALINSYDKEIIKTFTEDNEVIFEKKENGYVLKTLLGAKSNNSWVEEKFLDLIYKLNLSITLKDGGNEEIGFVFEDGVENQEELETDRVYINGVLKKD